LKGYILSDIFVLYLNSCPKLRIHKFDTSLTAAGTNASSTSNWDVRRFPAKQSQLPASDSSTDSMAKLQLLSSTAAVGCGSGVFHQQPSNSENVKSLPTVL
jgi:hypothetical protein